MTGSPGTECGCQTDPVRTAPRVFGRSARKPAVRYPWRLCLISPQECTKAQRVRVGTVLAVVSGILGVAAGHRYGVGPLIFVALVPGLVAQFRVLPAAYAGLGPALGFGGFLLGLGVWYLAPVVAL